MIIGTFDYTEKEYYKIRSYTLRGFCSKEDFANYCMNFLEELMKDNKKVLENLKNV